MKSINLFLILGAFINASLFIFIATFLISHFTKRTPNKKYIFLLISSLLLIFILIQKII